MARDYKTLLLSLLPKGKAWNHDPDSVSTEFWTAAGDELARLDNRTADLIVERDTRTTTELILEHERDLGLPDECTELAQTLSERRLNAHSKLISRGQQDKQYFIALAAAIGYDIEIIEYVPGWCGVLRCGEPIGPQKNLFIWRVLVTTTDDSVDISNLECVINKYKPGHTRVIFELVGYEFDMGFSIAFDAVPSNSTAHLQGAFSRSFSSAFDVRYGGAFNYDDFSTDFDKPG